MTPSAWPPIGAPHAPEPSDPAAPSAVRILVVDDESSIRLALRRLFTRIGWRVDDAADGAAALSLIRAAGPPYAVIISDLGMPVLDGIAFHDVLAREHPELLARTIFCTGDPASRDIARFIAATSRPVMLKPVDPDALRLAAERIVHGPRATNGRSGD